MLGCWSLVVHDYRDFRRVWTAHSVSIFGDQVSLVALPLATYAETRSAVAVGVVASAEAVTAVGLGLVAGVLGDRLPRRRLLVLTDAGRALVLLGLAAAVLLPGTALPALLVGALALGVLRVLHDAAAGAALPLLVAGPDLVAANGRMQASEAASTAVGPALAGGLIAVGGVATAFAVDALTFVASGAAVAGIDRLDQRAPEEAGSRPSLRAEIKAGLAALWADQAMVRVFTLMAAMNLLAVCVEAQFIPYAREVLGAGSLGVGLYFALGGTAALATSLLAGRSKVARGDAVVAGLLVFASGVLAAGVWPGHLTAALAYLGAGVGSALLITHAMALRHHRFPVEFQGRVGMAVRIGVFLLVPVALVGGGWLANASGPEALFVVTGAVGVATAAWGVARGLAGLRAEAAPATDH